ncbi:MULTISPECIES: hypothetical protein [unclassified Bradyrhizobium]|uniref:hypothetical protein n=1 Tax=unclassified Bradyrhizobium TaxID=2631580 RepID=UPI0029161C80|nr:MULTISPECIES: hypothetical protein [unclassified Bradyrhizobium]
MLALDKLLDPGKLGPPNPSTIALAWHKAAPSLRSYLEAERALTAALEVGNPDALDAARRSVELAARQAVDMLHHLAEFVQHEWILPFPDVGPVRIAIDAKREFLRNGKHVADVYLLRDVSVAFKHHRPRTGRIDASNDIAPGGFGFGKGCWGEGKYGGVEQIVVATNDGDRRALSSQHDTVIDDVRELRKKVKAWRKIYEPVYGEVRDHLAHNKQGGSEIDSFLAKTNIDEMKRMFGFLRALHEALIELYLNGRNPLPLLDVTFNPPPARPRHPGDKAYAEAQTSLLSMVGEQTA